jgi:uncharacterized protein with HEPN domain
MQHDTLAYLHDVRTAAENIQKFIGRKSFEEYIADLMIRSAVERQFEIIGEALARIARHDENLAAQIPGLRDIVDFRNVIAHGYDAVDNEIVWDIIKNHLPNLIQTCRNIL